MDLEIGEVGVYGRGGDEGAGGAGVDCAGEGLARGGVERGMGGKEELEFAVGGVACRLFW